MTAPSGEVVPLATGAEMRLTGEGATAVVCVNGGQARRGRGNVERVARVARRRLAPRFPELVFAEVRYRIKSWQRLDACVEDARAAIDAVGARADAAARLLDGRRRGDLGGRRAVGRAGARARAVDSRPALARAAAREAPRRPPRLARPLAARHPGRLARARRGAASSARARSASPARYELIPGALHGIALRAHWGRPAAAAARARRGSGASRLSSRRSEAGAARAARRPAPSRSRRARAARAPRITHHETSIWPRVEAVPRRGGERVVVVVPALAEDEQRDEPVVARLVARAVVLAAEHVADRVHAEGRVLVGEDADQAAPDEPLEAAPRPVPPIR